MPPLARYDEVGLRKKKGALGTALPSSFACSLRVVVDIVNIVSPCKTLMPLLYLKLRPMATILRPEDKKFRADIIQREREKGVVVGEQESVQ